jgi:hypothetical protein
MNTQHKASIKQAQNAYKQKYKMNTQHKMDT